MKATTFFQMLLAEWRDGVNLLSTFLLTDYDLT